MATARVLKMSMSLQAQSSSSYSSSSSGQQRIPQSNGERRHFVLGAAATSSILQISERKMIDQGLDLGIVLLYVSKSVNRLMNRRWVWVPKFNLQMLLEKGILDCRLFTLLAIGGSLLSSVICYVEGCLLTMESYVHYFQASGQTHFLLPLIEAIDMYLLGTAMLTFGMAIQVMFMGSSQVSKSSPKLLKETVFRAKSRIGHAVLMILQVQVLEKLKCIPVVTPVDLAFVAGALFLSSSSLFVLSRMTKR